jgi:hypothetical protein
MTQSEHAEQVAVVSYLQIRYPQVLFWSTPNGAMLGGGKLGAIRMNALKATGLLPGVSDLIIFEPMGGFSCMFVEMKRERGGVLSENQAWFIAQVEERGAYAVVAEGADEAIEFIDDYFAGKIKK